MYNKLIFALFLIGYYVVLGWFFMAPHNPDQFPVLRERFGTVMWHSSDIVSAASNNHLYCYYPGAANRLKGEYLLKRVNNISDCQNWYGLAVFNEGSWVSEREKLWWYPEQQQQEGLAQTAQKSQYDN